MILAEGWRPITPGFGILTKQVENGGTTDCSGVTPFELCCSFVGLG